jgi:hydroxyacyl-ACP dehydratase HTD2-like protein with hotdog domain
MRKEGYPGSVVRGLLAAMLLRRRVREHTAQPGTVFRFRGRAPLFKSAPFRLIAMPANRQFEPRAEGPDAKTAMNAAGQLG